MDYNGKTNSPLMTLMNTPDKTMAKHSATHDRERLETLEQGLITGVKSARRELSMDEVREKGLISVLRERQRKLSQ